MTSTSSISRKLGVIKGDKKNNVKVHIEKQSVKSSICNRRKKLK